MPQTIYSRNCSLQMFSANVASLFRVDYLLPRTIIAAFNATELKDAIETKLYPAEVCCAAVYYFMKTHECRDEEVNNDFNVIFSKFSLLNTC
jgi:hypothetical protein